jgi:hypothetical protein
LICMVKLAVCMVTAPFAPTVPRRARAGCQEPSGRGVGGGRLGLSGFV